MQKEIKREIEKKLFTKDNQEDWATLIAEYFASVKSTAKGVVLKCRYFEHKSYWRCLIELRDIRVYYEKDYFYKIVDEIIHDISMRAIYRGLLNPYEFEL